MQSEREPEIHEDSLPGSEAGLDPAPDWRPRYRGSDRLAGKAAVITGSDSGIGRATAALFAREGADIAIVYLLEDQDAQATRRIVEGEGRRAITVRADIGSPAACEAVIADPNLLGEEGGSRLAMFRVFHRIWNPMQAVNIADGLISHLPVSTREAMLLTMVEGFSTSQAADILQSTDDQVRMMIAAARQQLEAQLRASVMIIEDEAIIAMHLRKIVQSLGNTVAGVARTRDEAVTMARDVLPDLILADISLADGSSGIDAVKDIL